MGRKWGETGPVAPPKFPYFPIFPHFPPFPPHFSPFPPVFPHFSLPWVHCGYVCGYSTRHRSRVLLSPAVRSLSAHSDRALFPSACVLRASTRGGGISGLSSQNLQSDSSSRRALPRHAVHSITESHSRPVGPACPTTPHEVHTQHCGSVAHYTTFFHIYGPRPDFLYAFVVDCCNTWILRSMYLACSRDLNRIFGVSSKW